MDNKESATVPTKSLKRTREAGAEPAAKRADKGTPHARVYLTDAKGVGVCGFVFKTRDTERSARIHAALKGARDDAMGVLARLVCSDAVELTTAGNAALARIEPDYVDREWTPGFTGDYESTKWPAVSVTYLVDYFDD